MSDDNLLNPDNYDMSSMGITDPETGQYLGETLVLVHPVSQCENRLIPCCIHSPSDHHMLEWPMTWRSDTGVMERRCPHGTGHPDPDHMAFVLWVHEDNAYQRIHGCCPERCCQPR